MSEFDDRYYHAKITRREDFAEGLWMVRIQRPSEFKFLAGQYATLNLPGSDVKPEMQSERPYCMVSSPYQREIEFFFELVSDGGLMRRLYELQPGDELLMRNVAEGRFILDAANERRNHLLISAGTGVAPFVSYVRTLYRDWKDGRFRGECTLFLLNGARRSWEFGYHHELLRVARETAWLKYVPTVSHPWDDERWPGEKGQVDELIRKYTDQWGLNGTNTTGYLCGHAQMIESAKGILRRIGFGKEQLKEEAYWIAAEDSAAKPDGD